MSENETVNDGNVAEESSQNVESTENAENSAPQDAGATQESELGKKAAESESVVPEKYEISAGEGKEIDQEMLEFFTPTFQEMQLTNEAVEKLVKMHDEYVSSEAEKTANLAQERREKWFSELRSDDELGKGNFEATKAIGHVFMSAYEELYGVEQAQEFKDLLNVYGIGDNKHMWRTVKLASKALKEAEPTNAGGSRGQPPSREELLYGQDVKR